ncbi:MAG: anaerobic ribonucleoside-triphosphate reductase activating protein [Bacilli bacterium]|nr:anaerobic ribonucleoside-triphosphate reductase activating protein [Bacilli bacterium]
MTLKVSSNLQYDSIVDGDGIRTVIWTQGCSHHCPGCHNPNTHDINKGFNMDVEDIKQQLLTLKDQDGITLSGGDPFMQPEACLEIAKYAKSINLNVWCYTGYTYEELLQNPKYLELLKQIDVLVDGRFILSQKSFNLKYRGSENQRIIDVKKSLENNKVELTESYNTKQINFDLYQKKEYLFI